MSSGAGLLGLGFEPSVAYVNGSWSDGKPNEGSPVAMALYTPTHAAKTVQPTTVPADEDGAEAEAAAIAGDEAVAVVVAVAVAVVVAVAEARSGSGLDQHDRARDPPRRRAH